MYTVEKIKPIQNLACFLTVKSWVLSTHYRGYDEIMKKLNQYSVTLEVLIQILGAFTKFMIPCIARLLFAENNPKLLRDILFV